MVRRAAGYYWCRNTKPWSGDRAEWRIIHVDESGDVSIYGNDSLFQHDDADDVAEIDRNFPEPWIGPIDPPKSPPA